MDDLALITEVPPCPARPADAHKGTFGTVIVVGGCPEMIGAPALCAAAALRSGVGLVRIATDRNVLPTAIAIEPGATGIILETDIASAKAAIDDADPNRSAVLAIGPGLGSQSHLRQLVLELLAGDRAAVLDADGLNLLATTPDALPKGDRRLVMTPHPGEFAKLAQPLGIDLSATDPVQRPSAAAALARHYHAVAVLKGPDTVVTDGRQLYVNTTGNCALATAGTGDVLTGLIASLIAQHMSPFNAASLGAYLHGLAADIFASEEAWQAAVRSPRLLKRPAFAYAPTDPNLPRVLIYGDSISIGYTGYLREILKGEATVQRIPCNGGDTASGFRKLKRAGLQKGRWDVIHFNWGLHELTISPFPSS